ncbi:MAG: O-antigen ligase family protein, partial [Candidatus Omnitrophica bacterium]|nr:O-antigen ligase family protein [Candidatus Omnitrophota bacterium]
MNFFNVNFMDIPGAKPVNLLFFFVITIALFNLRNAKEVPPRVTAALTILGGVFIVSIFRSLAHLPLFNQIWIHEMNAMKYLLSYAVRPLMYFISMIMILKFVRDQRHFEEVIRMVIVSLIFLSAVLLYLYIFQVPDKTDLLSVRDFYYLILRRHGNDLANFYIMAIPLILSRLFLRKDIAALIALGVCLPVIGILCSRTAYATLFFSIIYYSYLTKRTKYLPIIMGLVLVLFAGVAYQGIQERAMKGFESKDYEEILAGRFDGIWMPLVQEYTADHAKLMFGQGRFAIMASDSYRKGFLHVEHPHNMYLEQLIDSGLLGAGLIFFVFIKMLMEVFRRLKNIEDPIQRDYQMAIWVGLLSFFISGFVGRSLYPQIQNTYFWIFFGLAYANIALKRRDDRSRKSLKQKAAG